MTDQATPREAGLSEGLGQRAMDDREFRGFLDLLMCSDPWPMGDFEATLKGLADRMACERGYDNWIDAYHQHVA
jgi:hypothetical protein